MHHHRAARCACPVIAKADESSCMDERPDPDGHDCCWVASDRIGQLGVFVTGGSGKAGRAVVRDLVEHGYDVLNVDLAKPVEPLAPFLRADLTDYGQVVEALRGAEAVVHLAAIPAPDRP